MKIFISQPMHGRSDDEILNERAEIAKNLEEVFGKDVKIIDSFTKSSEDISKGRIWMLGGSIQLMFDADVLVFVEGYEKAKGCMIEKQVAVLYNLKILFYSKKDKKLKEACSLAHTVKREDELFDILWENG